MIRIHQQLVSILVIGSFALGAARADVWPRFRGANGDGQASAVDVPSDFTEADYAWRMSLPGLGHSSPVVWNDRVFVTSANPETAELIVMCFDLKSGEEQWQRRFAGGTHSMHRVNSYVTATPALDADHVYIAWKAGDMVKLAALTHDGRDAWQHDVGRLSEPHGFGTSPMVVGDVVCMTKDTEVESESYIFGVDRLTGDELWRQPCGAGKTSYATPVAWQGPGGRTLILMATMSKGLTAYDPATGEIVWNAFTKDLPDRCVSSPVLVGDMVLVSCGSANHGKHLIGAKLGAPDKAPTEIYRLTKNIPNIPTPLVVDDMVVLWYDKGIVSCIDAATGELHWRERIGGNFHASPLLVGDRIFNISLDGDVCILAPGKEYKLLARHQLGEGVVSTPAVADGRLLIRTERSLICLGGK